MAYTRIRSKKTRTQHVVETPDGDMVVELHPTCVTIRPLRSRDETALVSVSYGRIYARALIDRNGQLPKRRRRR